MELDLHGVRHHEVERLIENFVLLNEPPLTIIIGNSDKMFDIVSNKLNKLDVEWERWNWASIKVLK
tara:strand:+ start:321 stop:518 length:198 start_codon:yes stop_codon:yes gene_type:complete